MDLALGKDRALGLDLGEEHFETGLAPSFQQNRADQILRREPEPSASTNPINAPSPSFTSQFTAQVTIRDIEMLSAKLDALKAMLDNISRRLDALEKIAREGI
jgi:hypothetical protein